jgi:hypothetical protein
VPRAGPPLTKENGLLSAVSEISGCAASAISTYSSRKTPTAISANARPA